MTAPLHGFRDADDYYARSNAKKAWLGGIRMPTLMINSANDPFLPVAALPSTAQVAAAVRFEVPAQGGHAGFYDRAEQGGPWLPQRRLQCFGDFL